LEAASRSDVERSSAVLHQWLADNGFKKLSGPQEIKAVTMWSGNPAEFTEVYTKPISPRFPQSLFIVTVLDNEPVKFFRITLTSAVAGTRAEHARQESLVRAEEEKFQDGLRGALPGKKP
jgi:hypothetical protein